MPFTTFTPSCSPSEYTELLTLAKSLSPSEIPNELLECARYGELDSLKAILEIIHHSSSHTNDDDDNNHKRNILNSTDSHGTTPLHKACANGHTSTVQFLLSQNVQFLTNQSGNTPLHWAAANGHEECVKLLLEHFDDTTIDVLQKNGFGRSALTEGFTSENTILVGMLLEHPSAEEEKLLRGGEEVEEEDVEEKEEKKGVVHEFVLFRGCDDDDGDEKTKTKETIHTKSLFIRELPIRNPDNPFGTKSEEDTTGLGIWCASLIMARWMSSPSVTKRFRNKSVLELGAGCGVPGFASAVYGSPKSVTLTDLNPSTLRNLRYNQTLNQTNTSSSSSSSSSPTNIHIQSLDWNDPTTAFPPQQRFDIILGSDLIYQMDIVPLLHSTIKTLLKPSNGIFFYVAPVDGRDGLDEFLTKMKRDFKVIQNVAPKDYYDNPLGSGDDDLCFLYFGELKSSEFVLYEFHWK